MKPRPAAVALLAAGLALGQQVEREVFLPDSFVGPEYPKTVCFLSWQSTGKAFAAGYGTLPALTAFDPATGERVGRRVMPEGIELLLAQPDGPLVFAVGRQRLVVVDGVRDSLVADVASGDGPGLAVLEPDRRSLYLADRWYGSVARYDYSGNRLDSIGVRLTPAAFSVARAANRLYVAGRQDTVAAIDLSADSVVRYIGVGDEPSALVHDAARNRLYCANRMGNSVSVIDCTSDSVLATVPVGDGPVALALHAGRNRLYCANRSASRVAVVDLEALVVANMIPVSRPVALLCDTAQDRLYCGTVGSELAVIDCRAESVRALLRVGEENGALALARGALLCASLDAGTVSVVRGDSVCARVAVATAGPRAALVCGDKLYVAEERLARVAVLGLPGLEPLTCLRVGARPRALCRGPGSGKVYVACYGDGTVHVIDAQADTVAGRIASGNSPYHMVLDSAGGKLYCVNFGSADLAVIDCLGDSVLRRVAFGRACRHLVYNHLNRKVYGASHDSRTIDVLDCTTDSVVARVPTSGNPWTAVLDATDNLVYSGTSWGAPVVCGAGDTAVGDVGDAFYVKGMCWDPGANRIYMANNYSSLVLSIDGPTHSVVGQVAVRPLPADMACLPGSGRVYLCHNRAGLVTETVSVIQYDSVIAELGVRPSPVEVVPDPERNRVYVLNWESSCITVISDSPSGVDEDLEVRATGSVPEATIVRGVLRLRDCHPVPAEETGGCTRPVLLDAAGRKVMELRPGENDIRHLAPGVYFLRTANGEGRVAGLKVVVTR